MSNSKYIKAHYEGEYQSIVELIESKEWNIDIKEVEKGTVYMKIQEEIEEEVYFFKNLVFNENTNTKIIDFIPITETEFQEAKALPHSVAHEEKKTEKKDENKTQNSNLENDKQTKIYNDFIRSISHDKSDDKDINNANNQKLPEITLEDIRKKIFDEYKDPFDFFFNKNYLIGFFMFASIAMVFLNL